MKKIRSAIPVWRTIVGVVVALAVGMFVAADDRFDSLIDSFSGGADQTVESDTGRGEAPGVGDAQYLPAGPGGELVAVQLSRSIGYLPVRSGTRQAASGMQFTGFELEIARGEGRGRTPALRGLLTAKGGSWKNVSGVDTSSCLQVVINRLADEPRRQCLVFEVPRGTHGRSLKVTVGSGSAATTVRWRL